jgi:hypothetical protein
VFLRTYVAAVRQDLDVPDDHVTYDLTVNYLAGTTGMYHAHLDEAGRDGPGKLITNLYVQGDALMMFVPVAGVTPDKWPTTLDESPGPLKVVCTEGSLTGFSGNIRFL